MSPVEYVANPELPEVPSGEKVNRPEYNQRMGVSTMPVQRLQPTSPQQQQMANMMARNVAEAQQRPYRTESADRVSVPSMSQLMSGIYGGGMGGSFNPYMGGGMSRGMGRGMGFGGFNPYMGGGGMGFGGFNPYMGGGGMGRSMGRGMGFGGFNPYMAQPQPMQLSDFARQMYGIGQRTNPYASMERIMPYVPPRQAGPEFGGIMPVMGTPAGIPQNTGGMASNMRDLGLMRNTMAAPNFRSVSAFVGL